jgi:hypothetical protein
VVGIRGGGGETTRMSGWKKPQHFWTVLSHGDRLCGAHVAYARIRGAWRTRGPLPHLCKNGFVPGYEVWTFHGESGTRVVAEDEHDCDVGDIDRIDKMLEAIEAEVTEDPPTTKVKAFFKLLKSSKVPLHEHTEVTLLAFITQLMAIKSKYFFPNNCHNDLVKLMSFRSLTKCRRTCTSPRKYENCMLFWKEHANEKSA